jgi:hypothetical protein
LANENIIDYKIIVHYNLHDLGKAVRDAIKEDWHPYEGIVMTQGAVGQAMVKYGPPTV